MYEVLSPKRNHFQVYLLAGFLGVAVGILLVLFAAKASPVIAIIMLCGMLITTVIFLYPTAGFLLASAVIPLERLGRITEDSSMYTVSLMRIVGLIVLAALLFNIFFRKLNLHFGLPFFIYGTYLCFGILTVFYTSDKLGTVRGCGAIMGNLLFFFLVINAVRSWRLAKIAVIVWLSASVLIGIYTIYDWHLGKGAINETLIGKTNERMSTVWRDTSEIGNLAQVPRAMGPTSHAAVYGINMILTIPFLLYLIRINLFRWSKITVVFSIGIVFYNILLTNTRAAIILAVIITILCLARKIVVIKPVWLIWLLIIASLSFPFMPHAVKTRVLDISNYTMKRSDTLQIRLEYWNAGLRALEDRWLMGAGVGNTNVVPKYMKKLGPENTTVHNEYLQTLVEVGLIGWLLFMSFVTIILWSSFKAASSIRKHMMHQYNEQYWFMVACQMAMIAVMLYGVQVDVFHFPLKGWWLVAGLSWVMYRLSRERMMLGSKEAFNGATTS